MSTGAHRTNYGDQMSGPVAHQPLVSIITPFYNTEQYIAECIESVLAQTYAHWEYILVNNQSTDASRTIAEQYARKDSRIRHILCRLGQLQQHDSGANC